MYCSGCGAYLSRRELLYCPYCSGKLPPEKPVFCDRCGTPLAPEHICLESALAPGNLPPAFWQLLTAAVLFFPFGIPALCFALLSPRLRAAGNPERADAFARFSRVFLFLSLLAFFLLFLLNLFCDAFFCENN